MSDNKCELCGKDHTVFISQGRVDCNTKTPGARLGIGGAPTRATTLPTTGTERKQYPVASGVLDYFPDAIAAIANVSYRGNEQHNAGKPLHWDRTKSGDEADTMLRHFLQRGSNDVDGVRHSAKMAWRALALLQKELEAEVTLAQEKVAITPPIPEGYKSVGYKIPGVTPIDTAPQMGEEQRFQELPIDAMAESMTVIIDGMQCIFLRPEGYRFRGFWVVREGDFFLPLSRFSDPILARRDLPRQRVIVEKI